MQTTAILRDGDASTLDLARAGLATQFRNKLEHLRKTGGTYRMSLRFESTRWVDRHAASDRGLAALAHRTALSKITKAEVFDLYDFAHSSRVVYFGYRNISRPDPGLFIGTPRGERRTVFLHLGWFAITARLHNRRQNPDRA